MIFPASRLAMPTARRQRAPFMSSADAPLFRTIEISTVLCLSLALLMFSGGDARRVLRYWSAAGIAFFVREAAFSGIAGDPTGLLIAHGPWPLLSQFAEHAVLVALVAGAYELRGGARVARSAVGAALIMGFLLALAVVSIPGLTTGAALAWRGIVAVTCAAGMLASVMLLRGQAGSESPTGRRVLLMTFVALALERLAAGYHLLSMTQGWAVLEPLDVLPVVELVLIVIGLMATVVVLLEREQVIARQGRSAADRALHELEAREAWFEQLIDGGTDIITVLDESAVIRFESPAVTRVLGWGVHEHLGQPALRFVHPEDQAVVAAAIAGVISGAEATGRARYRYRAKDGSWCTLESEGRELVREGVERRFVINSRDVTEREQLEQRLVHAGKMESVGRLAGGVAHDFNNLLTVIMANTDLAQANAGRASESARELEEIASAAARAARLTSQLLAFSRRQTLALQPVDLGVTVPAVLSMLRRLVAGHVEFVTEFAPGMPPVLADPGQIDQVLTNLVVNARDAMPHGGRIALSTSLVRFDARPAGATEDVTPGSYVCIRVTDTGPGIPAAIRDHLFEPFFTTKECGRGTGLGLATCYGIVRRHGGHIWYEDAPTGGATFVVCLPSAAEPAMDQTVAGVPPAESVRGSETILLVEDDPHVRDTTRRILVGFGYTVHVAEHGEEALDLLQRIPLPDAVVSDVMMPRLDGVELARRLREVAPELPIVLMSGYNEHGNRLAEAQSTYTRSVSKPFSPRDLLVALRELLEARGVMATG
jgi:PAS domain S-box-containing protein